MKLLKRLLVIEAIATSAFLLATLVFTAFVAVWAVFNPAPSDEPVDAFILIFIYTVVLGIGPVALFFAPIYIAMEQFALARWYLVAFVGSVPGIAFATIDPEPIFWLIGHGIGVALLAHLLVLRLAPNNSFKPTPLRGAA